MEDWGGSVDGMITTNWQTETTQGCRVRIIRSGDGGFAFLVMADDKPGKVKSNFWLPDHAALEFARFIIDKTGN